MRKRDGEREERERARFLEAAEFFEDEERKREKKKKKFRAVFFSSLGVGDARERVFPFSFLPFFLVFFASFVQPGCGSSISSLSPISFKKIIIMEVEVEDHFSSSLFFFFL